MLLSLFERHALLEVLPAQGDFLTLKTIRKLREALSLQEGEDEEYDIRKPGDKLDDGTIVGPGLIVWDTVKGAIPKEIPVGERATDIIVAGLKKLNQDQQLTDRYFTLYEKFVEST